MRRLTRWFALLAFAAACESATAPEVLHGDFSLVSMQGKPLPLPDGSTLLIGDSLRFDETVWPRRNEQTKAFATVVHKRSDGTLEILSGYQTYERRGDTVITAFACRFNDLCLAWDIFAAPETGVLRNDSLIFSPKSPDGPTRIYRRAH